MLTTLQALRDSRPVSDAQFDRIYPDHLKLLSETHWTPLEIARRGAQLLVTDSKARILDVGSGIGKFCLIGALSTSGYFYGVEQRAHLVDLSNRLAIEHGIERVRFFTGDIRNLDWAHFQGFYLYNPFVEHLYASDERIDASIDCSEQQYRDLVRWVQLRLHHLPLGTRVATYHGFGGEMPPGYELICQEPGAGDFLRLWVKTKE